MQALNPSLRFLYKTSSIIKIKMEDIKHENKNHEVSKDIPAAGACLRAVPWNCPARAGGSNPC